MRKWAEQHPVRVNIEAAKCIPRSLQSIAATRDDKFICFTVVVKRKKVLIERSEQKNGRQQGDVNRLKTPIDADEKKGQKNA